MIKLVAFDWNGTIISDAGTVLRAENIALQAVGVKTLSLSRFQEIFEIPIKKYWKNLGLSESFLEKHFNTIEDIFHLNFENFSNKTRTRLGVKYTLGWLEKQKIKRIIYSNHTVPNINRQLIRLEIKRYIEEVLGRELGDNSQIYSRSKEEKLKEYLTKHGIKPKEVMSVGDTEEEIEIAKNQGYISVAITGGWNSTARLKKHKPDFLIHNMKELIPIVKKLNK